MSDAEKFQYLFWAYNVIWILIAGYLLMLGVRLRRVQRQIQEMGIVKPAAATSPPIRKEGKMNQGRVGLFGVVGLLVGALIGYLLRPAGLLIGQLSFGTVITRGANLEGMDRMLVPLAQSSFNYLLTGAILGTAIAALIGYFSSKPGTAAP
jgi:CcmD family protein